MRAEVDAVFRRGLAVDPRHRYQSIATFWSDLSSALGTAATEWMPLSPEHRSPQLPDLVLDVKPVSSRAPARAPAGPTRLSAATFEDDDDGFELGAQLPLPAQRGAPIALDGVGLTTVPPSRRARAVARTVDARVPRSEALTIRAKLRQPIQWILVGCAVMIADYAFTAVNGEPFTLGPVRAFWIAAPLVIAGVGLGVLRLFASDD